MNQEKDQETRLGKEPLFEDGADEASGEEMSPEDMPDAAVTPAEEETRPEEEKNVEVVGIRFRTSGKTYYFDPRGNVCAEGQHAIVETARGVEYGEVAFGNRTVPEKELVAPLRPVLRISTRADDERYEANREAEKSALEVCAGRIAAHGLEMKLIDAEYTFDNSKLLFYFTADGRVDFRELVKDLASIFHCRIELRQMGIRDEAKALGGLGICGRPFCCHSFLPDFVQVSIKMAKEQSLSLNAAKISGACGRLMCCLRYEYDTYVEEGKRTPAVGSTVHTRDGDGVVVEAKPLIGMVKVRPLDDPDAAPVVYPREEVFPGRGETSAEETVPAGGRRGEKPARNPKSGGEKASAGTEEERARPGKSSSDRPAPKAAGRGGESEGTGKNASGTPGEAAEGERQGESRKKRRASGGKRQSGARRPAAQAGSGPEKAGEAGSEAAALEKSEDGKPFYTVHRGKNGRHGEPRRDGRAQESRHPESAGGSGEAADKTKEPGKGRNRRRPRHTPRAKTDGGQEK